MDFSGWNEPELPRESNRRVCKLYLFHFSLPRLNATARTLFKSGSMVMIVAHILNPATPQNSGVPSKKAGSRPDPTIKIVRQPMGARVDAFGGLEQVGVRFGAIADDAIVGINIGRIRARVELSQTKPRSFCVSHSAAAVSIIPTPAKIIAKNRRRAERRGFMKH
jgi:hypothetical protein